MYTAGYKQNTKTSLAKPPFTPVNAPGSNSGFQTANAGQNAAPGQQAPSQRQAQMQYMSQPQVAAVLTHQPPPAPPPSSSQNQSVQPGQNTGANRGIPPPPQPSQGQNYPTGPSSNQPSGQQFIPQQGYNASPANADNMHTYTGPSRPIAYPNAAYFSHQAYFIANQNHQQMHYDNQSNYIKTFTPNPNQQQQQSYQKREKKPLLIVDPNSKKPINLQNQSQSASSTHTTNTTTTTTTTSTNSTTANTSSGYKAESDRKSDKKDSAVAVSINEDKKLDTTVNEDFQTQIIRKMKDQQHTAEEIDSNVATTTSTKSTTANTRITKIKLDQWQNLKMEIKRLNFRTKIDK